MKGKFIVLEGIDACGKDTQQEMLEVYFKENNLQDKFVFLKVLDESKSHTNNLRTTLFKSNHKWTTNAEIMMFWADKFEIVEEIKIKLENGINVIMNRWEISNPAYQIYGKQREDLRDFCEYMKDKLDNIERPDLYILFDITVAESEKRRLKRSETNNETDNYYEEAKKEFFERVILGYKIEIQKYQHIVIDGGKSKEEVFEDTLNAIQNIVD